MENLKQFRKKPTLAQKCDICDKEFKNTKGLKYHVNIIHNLEKEYQCNVCQKAFNTQRKLTLHEKIVHENKKHHKCDSCEKSFAKPERPHQNHS